MQENSKKPESTIVKLQSMHEHQSLS